ncbi:Hypothetical_protein [Hexamita inflata]|uniref:Hypothetical_protein n=1 Tax=Hexamita inflata TaxID=28002 RepID=A0AA86QMK7_9EUKA|nr:Hypothetical protein HINF_LOCUS43449 [Hexamita inflata]
MDDDLINEIELIVQKQYQKALDQTQIKDDIIEIKQENEPMIQIQPNINQINIQKQQIQHKELPDCYNLNNNHDNQPYTFNQTNIGQLATQPKISIKLENEPLTQPNNQIIQKPQIQHQEPPNINQEQPKLTQRQPNNRMQHKEPRNCYKLNNKEVEPIPFNQVDLNQFMAERKIHIARLRAKAKKVNKEYEFFPSDALDDLAQNGFFSNIPSETEQINENQPQNNETPKEQNKQNNIQNKEQIKKGNKNENKNKEPSTEIVSEIIQTKSKQNKKATSEVKPQNKKKYQKKKESSSEISYSASDSDSGQNAFMKRMEKQWKEREEKTKILRKKANKIRKGYEDLPSEDLFDLEMNGFFPESESSETKLKVSKLKSLTKKKTPQELIDFHTQAYKDALQFLKIDVSNSSPKELCVIIDALNPNASYHFWYGLVKDCIPPKNLSQHTNYYKCSYKRVLYKGKLTVEDKKYLTNLVDTQYDQLSSVQITKLAQETEFLNRDIFSQDILNFVGRIIYNKNKSPYNFPKTDTKTQIQQMQVKLENEIRLKYSVLYKKALKHVLPEQNIIKPSEVCFAIDELNDEQNTKFWEYAVKNDDIKGFSRNEAQKYYMYYYDKVIEQRDSHF